MNDKLRRGRQVWHNANMLTWPMALPVRNAPNKYEASRFKITISNDLVREAAKDLGIEHPFIQAKVPVDFDRKVLLALMYAVKKTDDGWTVKIDGLKGLMQPISGVGHLSPNQLDRVLISLLRWACTHYSYTQWTERGGKRIKQFSFGSIISDIELETREDGRITGTIYMSPKLMNRCLPTGKNLAFLIDAPTRGKLSPLAGQLYEFTSALLAYQKYTMFPLDKFIERMGITKDKNTKRYIKKAVKEINSIRKRQIAVVFGKGKDGKGKDGVERITIIRLI